MNDEQLAEIKARCEAATPGQWAWDEPFDNWITQNGLGYLDVRNDDGEVIATLTLDASKDADFIAHAREDIPALLAEVDRLRAENARLRAHIERLIVPAYIHSPGYPQDDALVSVPILGTVDSATGAVTWTVTP